MTTSLITGANKGLGFETVRQLVAAGHQVWIGARHEVDRGGHFAAWEEPELFSTEVRAAFSSLR
jgi:NAD(P)-dependent dehydrogenase (short-subunit alcohol dehydrogenase family)